MQELADHVIAVAHQNDLPITNLQVQKVMFFSLGMHIRRTGDVDDLAEHTYDEPFEKWQYGPVVETIYYLLSSFKNHPITYKGNYDDEYADWNGMITRLLRMNVFDLVSLSHKLPSWANFRDRILNREFVASYTLPEIAEDFING